MAELSWSIQFSRLFAGNLDKDYVLKTEKELNDYLTSPLRYAGQLVYCEENDVLYRLNKDKTKWDEIGKGNGIEIIDNYSKLPVVAKNTITYVLNDYIDTTVNPNVTYEKGFYLYNSNLTTPQWERLNIGSDNVKLPKWENGKDYILGDIFENNDLTYEVIKEHTSTTFENDSDNYVRFDTDHIYCTYIQYQYLENNSLLKDKLYVVTGIPEEEPSKEFTLDKWISNTEYEIGTIVYLNKKLYKCITQHTSSENIEDDIINWEIICGGEEGSTELTEDITSNIEVGGIKANKTYKTGTSITEIVKELLVKYFPSTISLSISPNTTIYEIGKSITSLDLIANVGKKSNDIESIKYYIGNSLIGVKDKNTDVNLPNGGRYTYKYTTPITTNSTIKAIVNDGKTDVTSNLINIEFVYPFYAGTSNTKGDNVEKLDKALFSNKLTEIPLVYTSVNQYLIFAIPNTKTITSIQDSNGFENIESWNYTLKSINGINYKVYTSNTKVTCTNFDYNITIE